MKPRFLVCFASACMAAMCVGTGANVRVEHAAGQAVPAATANVASPSVFKGRWLGTTTGPRMVDVVLDVDVKNGQLVAQGALPALGSFGDSINGLAESQGHLTGSFSAIAGSIRFDVVRVGETLDGVLMVTAPLLSGSSGNSRSGVAAVRRAPYFGAA